MNTYFLIALLIWILTIMANNILGLKYSSAPNTESKRKISVLFSLIMFFMWASWGFMAFSDPVKMNIFAGIKYLGLVMFVIGVVFFVLAEKTKSGVSDKGSLVTEGVYSRIRHPMYLGQLLMAVGLPVFAQGFVTLCLSVVWIAQLIFWKFFEERQLIAKYPEYQDYKKRTWF
jgi:protein-S-isoprenylcysteine O-methyltransferase Ste14